jgi:four helix bundle protein
MEDGALGIGVSCVIKAPSPYTASISPMPRIRTFRDLNVYESARREALHLFHVTKDFPKSEMFALTDQIRRSSRAVGALLAESWGRRRYEADFVNRVSQAMAEAHETQAWLDAARDCGYLSPQDHSDLDARWQRIGGMLHRMIQRSDSFCRSSEEASSR